MLKFLTKEIVTTVHGRLPSLVENFAVKLPLPLQLLDRQLQNLYVIDVHTLEREQRNKCTDYHAVSTKLVTHLASIPEPKPILTLLHDYYWTIQGCDASAVVFLGNDSDIWDLFVQGFTESTSEPSDEIVAYEGRALGITWRKLVVKKVPGIFILNSLDEALYLAIMTKAFEIAVGKAIDFKNEPMIDSKVAQYNEFSEKHNFTQYTLFLLSVLRRYFSLVPAEVANEFKIM